MNIRLFVFIFAALPLIGSAESSGDGTGPRVSIEIGNLASPISAVTWLEEEFRGFAAAHREIEVQTTSFIEPNREQFPLVTSPPLPRNVMGIASHFGYEAPYLAAKGLIVPIDSFLPDPVFSWDQFYEAYWEPVTYDGKRWGVPWAAFTQLLLCDQRLFAAAGVACPPRTWEDLLAAAKQLTVDSDKDGTVEQWGLRTTTRDDSLANVFITMILQKGGQIMENGRFAPSPPILRECAAYLTLLVLGSNAAKMDNRPLESVLQDDSVRYAMHLVPTRTLDAVPREKNLILAPLPTCGPELTYCPSCLYLCILRATPQEEAASWELVKWLCRPDVSIPRLLQGYPCRKGFTHRPDFAAAVSGCCQGVENIYLQTEHGIDFGGYAIGRDIGARVLWLGLVPALKGLQPFEDVFEDAVIAANAQLRPLPLTRSDPGFYK